MEEAQSISDLSFYSHMSHLDELSGDEDLNDFSEDKNISLSHEGPKHHPGIEKRFILAASLYYQIMIVT